jgi:hypothetical protein
VRGATRCAQEIPTLVAQQWPYVGDRSLGQVHARILPASQRGFTDMPPYRAVVADVRVR